MYPTPQINSDQLLADLRHAVERLESRAAVDETRYTTGCGALDRLLPGQGMRRGQIVEWLTPGSGAGAGLLALSTITSLLRQGRVLVVCDVQRSFYAGGLSLATSSSKRVIYVRVSSEPLLRWAIDQALRSPAVAAVWARLDRLDEKTSRRYQLAAEAGGTVGMFIRPAQVRGRPSWADVQLAVTPLVGHQQRTWRIECVRARGPTLATMTEIERNPLTGALHAVNEHHETRPLSLAATLARATSA